MTIITIFLTDIREVIYSPFMVETTKALLVSIGWVGGLAAFVYWKDKRNNVAVSI